MQIFVDRLLPTISERDLSRYLLVVSFFKKRGKIEKRRGKEVECQTPDSKIAGSSQR